MKRWIFGFAMLAGPGCASPAPDLSDSTMSDVRPDVPDFPSDSDATEANEVAVPIGGLTTPCAPGQLDCLSNAVWFCDSGAEWVLGDECETVCIAGQCTECVPGGLRCDGLDVQICGVNGNGYSKLKTCEAGHVCVDGGCCDPNCGDRDCGPDACGGACGVCEKGDHCSPSGHCYEDACGREPTCECITQRCGGVESLCDIFTFKPVGTENPRAGGSIPSLATQRPRVNTLRTGPLPFSASAARGARGRPSRRSRRRSSRRSARRRRGPRGLHHRRSRWCRGRCCRRRRSRGRRRPA
jgi:hypothetical protein